MFILEMENFCGVSKTVKSVETFPYYFWINVVSEKKVNFKYSPKINQLNMRLTCYEGIKHIWTAQIILY